MPRPSETVCQLRPTAPRLPNTEASTKTLMSGCAIWSWRSTKRCSRNTREWRSCWSSRKGRSEISG
nr:unnamed protein product [Callosobruchus analis]